MRSESGMPEETDVIFKADFSDGRVGFFITVGFCFFRCVHKSYTNGNTLERLNEFKISILTAGDLWTSYRVLRTLSENY